MQPVVARALTHRYNADPALPPVLNAVDLAIAPGEFVILSGPTGSGKSTLITLIGALRRHQEGLLEILGCGLKDAPERTLVALRRQIGFIFQDHHLFDALTPRETLRLDRPSPADRFIGMQVDARVEVGAKPKPH